MPPRLARSVAVASLLAPLGCADSTGIDRDDEVVRGVEIEPTLAFGNPPLEGELRILPAENDDDLRFAVDLDEDGAIDESGQLDHGVSLFYRFEEPGVHRLRVRLDGPDGGHEVDRFVVVGDPSAFLVERRTGLSGFGIAYDDVHDALYVSNGAEIVEMDPIQLEPREVRAVDGHASELVLSPQRDRLFAAMGQRIAVLYVPDFELLQRTATGGIRVHALDNRSVYTATGNTLILLDTVTSTAERSVSGLVSEFSVSPDGRSIAVLRASFDQPDIISMLDAEDFGEVWSQAMPADVETLSLEITPDGGRVYVMDRGPEFRFLVLDAATGEIRRNMIVGNACAATFSCESNAANSSTLSHDGRYVIFATDGGGYFIDTTLDLPVLRTLLLEDPDFATGCCSVAAHPEQDVYFFANPFGFVTRVRLRSR